MSIAFNQINQSQAAQFVLATTSGGVFSGILGGYIAGGGSFGSGVLTTTGGNQSVATNVTFLTNPTVPYSGGTGTAPSQKWVTDQTLFYVNSVSGMITGGFVTTDGNQLSIGGVKGFTGALNLGTAGFIGTHAATLAQVSGASGILAAAILAGSAATVSGILATSIAQTGASGIVYTNSIGATISGNLTQSGIVLGTLNTALSGFTTGMIAALSGFTTGVSGALQTLIGAAGSQVKVTGSSNLTTANFTGVGNVTVSYNGTTIIVSGVTGGGGAGDVTTAQFNALSGFVTGVSGYLNAQDLAISGFLNARDSAISGALQVLIAASTGGNTINNFTITGTGTINNTFSASGSMTNTFNDYTTVSGGVISGAQIRVTGSSNMSLADFSGVGGLNVYTIGNQVLFSGGAGGTSSSASPVSLSYYFDQYNLVTGLNQIEAFVQQNFTFTGFSIGSVNTLTQGSFSGSAYQRTPLNTKTNFVNFSLGVAMPYTGVIGFTQTITGFNRVGIDIYQIGTGITGLSVGLFGS